jgi:hypothetical protein
MRLVVRRFCFALVVFLTTSLAGFGVILSAGLCVVLANATVRRIRDVASEE